MGVRLHFKECEFILHNSSHKKNTDPSCCIHAPFREFSRKDLGWKISRSRYDEQRDQEVLLIFLSFHHPDAITDSTTGCAEVERSEGEARIRAHHINHKHAAGDVHEVR